MNCDALVQAAADKVAQIVAVEAMDRQETAAQHAADKAKEADAGGKKKEKEKARDEKAKTAALPSVNKDNSGTLRNGFQYLCSSWITDDSSVDSANCIDSTRKHNC